MSYEGCRYPFGSPLKKVEKLNRSSKKAFVLGDASVLSNNFNFIFTENLLISKKLIKNYMTKTKAKPKSKPKKSTPKPKAVKKPTKKPQFVGFRG